MDMRTEKKEVRSGMKRKMEGVKGILFDFGGTLDTNGDHWSEVLWRSYVHFGVKVEKGLFREAYVHGERTLAKEPVVKPHFHFVDVLRAKLRVELEYLTRHGLTMTPEAVERMADEMARYTDEGTRARLKESVELLGRLKERYRMALVSNFYGNIRTVLRDAGLEGMFEAVIESAVVGVRKPNPAIFALGVCALDLPASQVVVVGDSLTKDMAPAKALGCRTLWVKGLQWEETALPPQQQESTTTEGEWPTEVDGVADGLKGIMEWIEA